MKSYELTTAAALAAISAALQLVHVGVATPSGIWIDLVAVSWVLAYFLYGTRMSLVVSIAGALIITLFAPSTWLGALMKWTATIPMIAVPAAFAVMARMKPSGYSAARKLILPVALALVIRAAVIVPLNYYFAIPIWTGWTPEEAIANLPWYLIAGLNAIQGVLEVALAWLLCFRFRLDRFSAWR